MRPERTASFSQSATGYMPLNVGRLTNPAFHPFMYLVELNVYCEITIQPNIHAMNKKLFSFIDIVGNI
jgi:hypothetical protein